MCILYADICRHLCTTGKLVLNPRLADYPTGLALWDGDTSGGEMKQGMWSENCPWCWIDSNSQYSGSAGSCLWSMWCWSVPMDRVHNACPSLMVMKSSQTLPRCILHPLSLVQLSCTEPEWLEVDMHCGMCHKHLMASRKVTEILRADTQNLTVGSG